MKNARTIVVAALALSGALITGAAQARDHVNWAVNIAAPGIGIGVGNGGVYVAPPAVYVAPQPVYVAPQPVYVTPRYAAPVVYPAPYPVTYRPVYRPGWGDRDHDGIPNRYDRYDNRWDRDGDGIPNWRDRHNGRHGYGR